MTHRRNPGAGREHYSSGVGVATRRRASHRRHPALECLESRQLLSTVSELTPPSGVHTAPDGITVGPNGNLWFTEDGADQIGMINPATLKISEFPVPTANARPFRITLGSDGNLWFTELGADQIGMFSPTSGTFKEFSVPTPDCAAV